MSEAAFALDPRLEADTHHVAALPLCELRLMDDARYPWLILVPRRAGLVEIADLAEAGQALLWREANRSAAALRSVAPCDKLNLGALGNIVRQLHLHVVARMQGDHAWPGPVWGSGAAVPYDAGALAARLAALRQALAA
ncbi:MAG: diadenosine tetraphosphate hydrolase [Rhodanobacter sp. 68-29]|uniref:HIT domain-containing protein n=1 Tax=Rhodanobacter sp. PCA2 TaxID=2006117 RepID=UPI00086D8EE3|nr:HIT domain-containing protein [Rhodanobacter sp. PCA2]MBA2078152.1 diadenosine tetraphosphate hydrolase [Rhodanobacter sp. PCA2]MBN8923223.1 HIT domain-containing protein [Rhodanobacter sp.]ODU73764.1 MAG: diadenosine tetraphosphate hydrolase [Rhodanobacter sp. SCN 69-32]OJY59500.1 MAG: diadenosine tetraphosphate hydrolase [Rhodanobacter sp. 68-29]